MDTNISVKDGWTMYDPPEHESQADLLAGILDGYAEDCRRFARLARTARLDNLHHKFGLSWDAFCATRLRNSSEVVEAIIVGVEVLGEEMPVPLEVAERAGRAARAKQLGTTVEPLGEHGTNQYRHGGGYNITSKQRGTDANYLARRLRRDAPAYADALACGKYESVLEACIAAGIITPPAPQIAMSKSRHKAAQAIVAKMGPGYAKGLAIELLELVAPVIEEEQNEVERRVYPPMSVTVEPVGEEQSVEQNGLPYDHDKHMLGALCRHSHNYHETGKSLRWKTGNKSCVQCKKLAGAQAWQTKKERQATAQRNDTEVITSEETSEQLYGELSES